VRLLVRLLSSPRRRRRLARTLIPLAAAGALVGIALKLPNTTPHFPEVTSEPGTAVPEQRRVPMTRARKRDADRVIQGFLRHGLLRRDPVEAWSLATASFRAGSARRDWKRGELPISPYPANEFRRAGWRIVYSYSNLIGADVTVMPKLRSTGTIWVYAVELKDVVRGKGRRWLIDSWTPIKSIGGGTLAVAPKLSRRERAAARAREAAERRERERIERLTQKSRLGRAWLLVPLAVFGLILLIPLVLGTRSIVQARRAERRYASATRRR
jgi:hypothetical protein